MFQFRRFPTYDYFIHHRLTDLHLPGCPIRISPDISLAYSSPRLFAVNHVLLRLPVPRHSPCALCSLTFSSLRLQSLLSVESLPRPYNWQFTLVPSQEILFLLAVTVKWFLISPCRHEKLKLCLKELTSIAFVGVLRKRPCVKLCDSLILRYILSFCHSLDNCINYPF